MALYHVGYNLAMFELVAHEGLVGGHPNDLAAVASGSLIEASWVNLSCKATLNATHPRTVT